MGLDSEQQWRLVRKALGAAFASSFHYAIASINADGTPHVTPIGSLMLLEPNHAVYFEQFTRRLADNVRRDPRVCILGVNSSSAFWLRALTAGRFSSPPALRLRARVIGEPREPTEREVSLFRRRARWLRALPGYRMLWGDLSRVRDLQIDEVVPVQLGTMTNPRPTA